MRKRGWWGEPAVPMGIGPPLTNGGLWIPLLLVGAVFVWFTIGHYLLAAAVAGGFGYWGWRTLTGPARRRREQQELARQKAEYERRHGRPYPYGDRLYYSGR